MSPMQLISKIVAWLKPTPFPHVIKKHWYCGAWYMYLSDLRDKGEYKGSGLNPEDIESPGDNGKVCFNPWRTGLVQMSGQDHLIDGLIPALRIGDQVGLYKQIGNKYRESRFYDGASWDDGCMIDLALVKVITKPIHPASR